MPAIGRPSADAHRSCCAPKVRLAIDSPLEGTGFEPSVPHKITDARDCPFRLYSTSQSAGETDAFREGTGGLNPLPSADESVSAVSPGALWTAWFLLDLLRVFAATGCP